MMNEKKIKIAIVASIATFFIVCWIIDDYHIWQDVALIQISLTAHGKAGLYTDQQIEKMLADIRHSGASEKDAKEAFLILNQ